MPIFVNVTTVHFGIEMEACARSRPPEPQARKATFSDGFAVAQDGCRLSYNLTGNPEAEDKVLRAACAVI